MHENTYQRWDNASKILKTQFSKKKIFYKNSFVLSNNEDQLKFNKF